MTNATNNQVVNITGVRFSSSATEAWLNPAYPIGGDAGVNNTDIAPLSVRYGGTIGRFVIQQRDTHTARTTAVGAEVTTTYSSSTGTLSAGAIVIDGAGVDPAWVTGTQYFMVISASDDSVLTPGNYLATYGGETGGGATAVFNGIRRVTDGTVGNNLAMNSNTNEDITFQLSMFTDTDGLAVSNIPDNADVFRVSDTNVVDFSENPTVNGQPFSGGASTFIQLTDTPTTYAGNASAVVRVNGDANALELDPLVNSYPNGGTLFNDIAVPSAEYVLDAVDPQFHFSMPTNTVDLIANQRYDISFTSVFDNASGFTIRGDDIMFNGVRPTAIFRWFSDENRWIETGTSNTISLQTGIDAQNPMQISFDENALRTIRNNHLIEIAEATFNQDTNMVRNGIHLPFAVSNTDDHRQIIENEQNIATNSSRIDALETEVHNLEQNGTRIRTSAFHSITINATTTDEVIAYHSSHSAAGVFTPLPLSMTVSPSATGTVTAGSNQLPEALATPINEHLNQVFAQMVPTQDEFRRTNVGADSEFTWNGALDFTFATLALSVDAQTFMIPLQITIDSFGRVHHALRDVWPVDDEITWSHIGVRWFLSGDTSLNLGPVPADTPDGRQQLAVPMTQAQRTQYYVDHEEFTTVHFVDQNGLTRNINVDIPETPPTTFPTAPTWQDGFVYALVTLESTDEVEPGVGSHITLNIGANPFQPVQNIPLALWKTNIWLGTEGLNGTTEFSTDAGLQTVSWTPYTTGGYTLWFIDNLNITTDGNFQFPGDGLITTADPSVAANITQHNTINFIG